MPRYIDADKVMEEINRIGGHNLCEWETLGVKALIDRQPTADVAPKSEVAREIFEEVERVVNYAFRADITAWSAYIELKEKYTGEKK